MHTALRENATELLIGLALFILLIFVGGVFPAILSLSIQAALAYRARKDAPRERVAAFAFWFMVVNLFILAFGAWQGCPGEFRLTC